MATPETRRMLLAAAAACEDKKGEDTRILELDPVDSGLADFFLITSAANDRQALAIADEIELRLQRDFGAHATSVEGRRQAEWILLDYVDIVIHVFLSEKRAFYDIERLRKSARPLTPAELEAELRTVLSSRTREVRSRAASKGSSGTVSERATQARARKSPAVPSAPNAKTSTKGDPAVTAKSAKKAAKKAAKSSGKTAKPAGKKASLVTAVAPVEEARFSATAISAAGAKPPIVKSEAPDLADMVSFGAKPPIEKLESEPVSLAAHAAPLKRAAKAAKKAAPKAAKKSAKKSPARKAAKKSKGK
jgi:ribosome-associated protein